MGEEVKQLILSNFSDAGTTTEATSRLENLIMDKNEPLITFNSRYEALHNIAFGFGSEMQRFIPFALVGSGDPIAETYVQLVATETTCYSTS